ncbi:sigma-54-dependent transcriptional regulator [Roseiconus lacunae]|uniref:sigma-54-dependent transcriptional regulator n=1 Tax=Roseiconus lacunae TaxID=2605694 RepID=UPI0011F12340|nr:sigma-54 dependent transcriptional regulator [Roseiconus lacunae]
MHKDFHVLIVNSDPDIRQTLETELSELAKIDTAGSINEGTDKFSVGDFHMVIVDNSLPGEQRGANFIALLREQQSNTPPIVITLQGGVQSPADATWRGAIDIDSQANNLQSVRHQVVRAAEHHRLRIENRELKERMAAAGDMSGIVAQSRAMQELVTQIRQLASTDATVIICGEDGTGKELIARKIHDQSIRSQGTFVPLNLKVLPEGLLECELFGQEHSPSAGAARSNLGYFELAATGTLFLNQFTEIATENQLDLFRVLETRRYSRVGGKIERHAHARIILATERAGYQASDDGKLWEDLCDRLKIVHVNVPPLRSRREDIPLLVNYFLNCFCKRHRQSRKTITPNAMKRLVCARWPGNVRQLRNAIERIVVTSAHDVIQTNDLPDELFISDGRQISVSQSLTEITERAEKNGIKDALIANNHHRELTAKALKISVRTLHYKMNKYDLY